MPKYTKGEWKAVGMLDGNYRVCVDGESYDGIADVHTWQTEEETIANANILAAAPDLHYALVCLLGLFTGKDFDTPQDVTEVLQIVHQALQKSDGFEDPTSIF